MYIIQILPSHYMKYVLREAENIKEIKKQIRDVIQDTISSHTGGDCIININAEDEKKQEKLFFTIIIKDATSRVKL